MSGIILFGVVLMQVEHASSYSFVKPFYVFLPVLARVSSWKSKMMQVCKGN